MQPYPIKRQHQSQGPRTLGGALGFALGFVALLTLGYALAQNPTGTVLTLLVSGGFIYATYKLWTTVIEAMYHQVRSVSVPGIGTIRYRIEP